MSTAQLTAILITEDHANTDYMDVGPREPLVRSEVLPLTEAAKKAKRFVTEWHRGHNRVASFRCEQTGNWFHVSQNGRYWRGQARDWEPDAEELTLDEVLQG